MKRRTLGIGIAFLTVMTSVETNEVADLLA